MSKHNFIESTPVFGKYIRVIYCQWCGLVAWHWNANDNSKYQEQVGDLCKANRPDMLHYDKTVEPIIDNQTTEEVR